MNDGNRRPRGALAPWLLALAASLLALACRHTVGQARATGANGSIEGAQLLRLERGVARVRGVVSYPGGDRVDWLTVRLPDSPPGRLELELRWTPPRPGLRLGLDVFDDAHVRIARSWPRRRDRRWLVLDGVRRQVFIRVYARGRGDAGAYQLTVKHEPQPPVIVDWASLAFPDPPDLPAPPASCDPDRFDRHNPLCRDVCPIPPIPEWPGCLSLCPDPPDVRFRACWSRMPCPDPPDPRVLACRPPPPPCADPRSPDPRAPSCPRPPPSPVVVRILRVDVRPSDILVTVAAGARDGVTRTWRGDVSKRDGSPLAGGAVTIVRVDERVTVVSTRLSRDQLHTHPWVRLQP